MKFSLVLENLLGYSLLEKGLIQRTKAVSDLSFHKIVKVKRNVNENMIIKQLQVFMQK